MANKVMVELGDEVSKLAGVITQVQKKTRHFKSHLAQLQKTITSIKPIIETLPIIEMMDKLNKHLGERREETELFIRKLNEAQELITTCANVTRWNIIKRVHHMYKLHDLDESLWMFFHIDIMLPMAMDIKEKLLRERC
ncbi:NB-ARC domains-containing protein [Artemisia annua]|uniref:NB-ARC domains-containing protein n=1 Tax=Artemisia annua TaxID=35608 RepID=A0A2U1QPL7_ARTAN|nr:NB-ARC domains-containing protein [Artemisia annua]